MSLIDNNKFNSTFHGRGFVSFDLQTKRPSFLQTIPTKPHQNRFNFQARKQPLDDVKLKTTIKFESYDRHKTDFLNTTIDLHTKKTYHPKYSSIRKMTPNVGVPFSKMIARRPLAQASPYKNEFIRFQNIEKYKNRSNNQRNEPVRLFRGTLARNRKQSQYPGYLDVCKTLQIKRIIEFTWQKQSQNIGQHINQNEQVLELEAGTNIELLQSKNQSNLSNFQKINAANDPWSLQNTEFGQQKCKLDQSVQFSKECKENEEQMQARIFSKCFKLGNTFNQLLVEHGFVAAEKQPKPKFSPFNNQYKKQIVIESANPHKYQSLQGFVFENSSDSDVSLDEKDTKLLQDE